MGRLIIVCLGLLVAAFSLSGTGADHHCPFDWFDHKESCYKLSTRLASWDGAQRACKDEQENSQLASIQDVEEAVAVSTQIAEKWSFIDVWVGLSLSKRKGQWEWSDNSNVTYVAWEKGQPDNFLKMEFCAVLSAGSRYLQWNDKNCKFWHRFVCKFQPQSEAGSR